MAVPGGPQGQPGIHDNRIAARTVRSSGRTIAALGQYAQCCAMPDCSACFPLSADFRKLGFRVKGDSNGRD